MERRCVTCAKRAPDCGGEMADSPECPVWVERAVTPTRTLYGRHGVVRDAPRPITISFDGGRVDADED